MKKSIQKLKSIIKICRLKQWIKNGFVFATLIFSGALLNISLFEKAFIAFFLFCILSSAVYIFNDIMDVNEDRKHPKKRLRPLARGEISINFALTLAILMVTFAITVSYFINKNLFLTMVLYVLLNVMYCIKLKKLVIIDVMTIAAGFILRVMAGAAAIDIKVSSWLIICTGLISLYLGFGKRKNELTVLKENANEHRKTLSSYSIEYLDNILMVLLSLTIITYILYTINGTAYKDMIYTIPFVIYGTLRYQYLITEKFSGGSPEDTFTDDFPFLINVCLWLAVCVFSIYFVK